MSTMRPQIRSVMYKEEYCGKIIRASKKKTYWNLKINGKPVEIIMARSKASGKTSVTHNGKLLKVTKNFMEPTQVFDYVLDGIKYNIHQNKNGKYELAINGKDFNQYISKVDSYVDDEYSVPDFDDQNRDQKAVLDSMEVNDLEYQGELMGYSKKSGFKGVNQDEWASMNMDDDTDEKVKNSISEVRMSQSRPRVDGKGLGLVMNSRYKEGKQVALPPGIPLAGGAKPIREEFSNKKKQLTKGFSFGNEVVEKTDGGKSEEPLDKTLEGIDDYDKSGNYFKKAKAAKNMEPETPKFHKDKRDEHMRKMSSFLASQAKKTTSSSMVNDMQQPMPSIPEQNRVDVQPQARVQAQARVQQPAPQNPLKLRFHHEPLRGLNTIQEARESDPSSAYDSNPLKNKGQMSSDFNSMYISKNSKNQKMSNLKLYNSKGQINKTDKFSGNTIDPKKMKKYKVYESNIAGSAWKSRAGEMDYRHVKALSGGKDVLTSKPQTQPVVNGIRTTAGGKYTKPRFDGQFNRFRNEY